ncbi:hypothetical protein HYH03_005765 [Edaphochlamys debaryana]|uniref:Uncharacterized protein n=1 Tax=Edaphochlamys debaryana TaxID=47281 RepID=A0A835Y7G5_9CHLO|nr:hypothetical protein HYH03_005765 [Edaphochlamys debaryana]|eukprot:KAG2496163.1 hypothetical protein HYH03_005765 [Edaphochlamys debaryana]
MARPIDYSKWDNIDTGSSDEEPPPPRKPQPGGRAPAPSGALPPLPTVPNADEVICTYGPSRGDRSCMFFRTTSVPETHPVFSQGAVSPVAARVGLPLRVFRLDPRPSHTIPDSERSAFENQRVTFLMMSPASGFAAMEWQDGVGNVVLARADRRPLPFQHVEALWEFCMDLLNKFGDDEGVDPAVDITPAKWQAHFRSYARRYGRSRAEWRDVPLPWGPEEEVPVPEGEEEEEWDEDEDDEGHDGPEDDEEEP